MPTSFDMHDRKKQEQGKQRLKVEETKVNEEKNPTWDIVHI